MRRLGGAIFALVVTAFALLPWAGAQTQSGASADQQFTTDVPGAATGILTVVVHRPGAHSVRASATGYERAAATFRAR